MHTTRASELNSPLYTQDDDLLVGPITYLHLSRRHYRFAVRSLYRLFCHTARPMLVAD